MAGNSIKLNSELIQSARRFGKVENRSAPKQIEYWAKIGRISVENPDLTYKMIHDILLGLAQAEAGELESYTFGENNN